MSERYVHDIPGNFGENEDGDVVPSFDIDSDLNFDDVYKALAAQGEAVDEYEAPKGWSESLEEEFVDAQSLRASQQLIENIEPTEAENEYGSGYWDIIHVIESGIEKSKRGGYAVFKVIAADGKELPLGQYLSGDLYRFEKDGLLTLSGREAIRNHYVPIAEANVAPLRPVTAPIRKVIQQSEGPYTDWASAAANDRRDVE